MIERIRTTCPRDCYDSCGIVVERRGGEIHRVIGDDDHPVSRGALCGKCALAYNGVWRDANARLTQPLRRVGAKGEGRFESISWDAALGEVVARLQSAANEHGPASILHAHYTGTCSLIAGEFPLRFFNRLGATEVEPDTICNNAGHVALEYVYGTSVHGFDPKTAHDSACIVVWGANPSASAPHVHKYWLAESGAKIVVIDPIRHEAAEAADLHLQPFPGSDAALAFGLMHVAWRDGLLDRPFIDEHTLGWEELEPLLSACTPAWTEERTGVPVDLIEQTARLYAQGPSLLWLGQGLQRQPRGGNVMRACASLPAVTGNIGKPGAGVCYLNGGDVFNVDSDYLTASHLRTEPHAPISHMDLVDTLQDSCRASALVCWNINIAASAPRQRALHEALQREDLFTVVIDLFQTDTADFADIVLPAASFLEFDDLVVPYFYWYLSAQVKVTEPSGEALPNQEIFRRLAGAMGFDGPELFESDEHIIARLLADTGLDIGFDDLAKVGTVDPWAAPQVRFADHRYPTPSGRIELASDKAQADGHTRVPQPIIDPRSGAGHLRFLSPAGKWQMNDSYGNDPHVRKTLGAAKVYLNPADAAAAGVKTSNLALLSNATGKLVLEVCESADVPRGVALSHKGRWPRLEHERSNVNTLNDGRRTDMGASSAVHGIEVRITALDD